MTSLTNPPDAGPGTKPPEANALHVTVRFAAAPKPFHDQGASRDETVQSLKARVLNAFGLTDEQSSPDGNTIVYKLYHEKNELTDLSTTLGALAGHAHALELRLSQHVKQGACR